MTDDRTRQAAASLGDVADTIVAGTFAVAASALLVVTDASVSNLTVGVATIAALFVGDVVSSLLRGRPMPWRRPPVKTRWSVIILGAVLIILVGSYLEEFAPLRSFVGWSGFQPQYVDHPANAVLLIAALCLGAIALHALWSLVRLLRAPEVSSPVVT